MKKFLILFVLIFFASAPLASLAQDASRLPYVLSAQSFFDNQVQVQIPSTFAQAKEDLVASQYSDEKNRPKVVLTDKSQRPLLALNIAANGGDRETIIHLYRDIKNDIRTKYPNSRFLKTDVIRNRTLAIIEVILPDAQGNMRYNMMAFRYVGANFFLLNFSCPEEDTTIWQNTAREIAETVKVVAN